MSTFLAMSRRQWILLTAAFAVMALVWVGTRIQASRRQAAVLRSDPEEILSQPWLRRVALARGKPVFQAYCASCHNASGKGDPTLGVPDLTDEEHLYGQGRVAEIEEIARHGIRSADKRGWNLASMPTYASPHPYKGEPLPSLTPGQIEDLTQYLLAFTGRATDTEAATRGSDLYRYTAGCYDCHGYSAEGDSSIGAPSLVDNVWLYGHGSHDDIYRTLAEGRAGMSPAFGRVLSAADLRDVAVYVASLQTKSTQHAEAR